MPTEVKTNQNGSTKPTQITQLAQSKTKTPARAQPLDTIQIHEFQMSELHLTLIGTAPLMVNRQNGLLPGDPGYDERVRKDPRSPMERMLDACHLIPTNNPKKFLYGLPLGAIRKSIVTAGGRFSRNTKTGLSGIFQLVGGVSTSSSTVYPIHGPEPKLDSRPVNPQGGSQMTAHRPIWDPGWSVKIVIRFDSTLIKFDQIINLVRRAGCSVGVGCMRVEKGYDYGTFDVEQGGSANLTNS